MPNRASLVAVFITLAVPELSQASRIELTGEPVVVGAGVVSSEFTEIRAAASPDGRLMLWGSTNRPGGPGGWNIWLARRTGAAWSAPEPVSFNSDANDFDPAFSPDGRWVYFFSNRPGGLGGDEKDRITLTFSARTSAGYERGTPLSFTGPLHDGDALGPALDWHDRTVLLFSAAPPAKRADIYAVHYKVSQ